MDGSYGTRDWWNRRYQDYDIPWDSGVVPPELHALLDSGRLSPPGITLDLGCGTGTNANYLSSLGFTAIGVDIAWLAVQRARAKALAAGLQPRFCVGDVANVDFLAVQAIFALDMGCLHSLAPDDRARYARSMARRLVLGGLFLLYGFDQDVVLDSGPAGFAPGEIAARFAPYFRLQWHKPSTQGDRSVGWYLLRRVPVG